MVLESIETTEKIVRSIPIDEIKEALVNEYRRRLIRYKMIDEVMKKKYGMDFNKFESENIVEKRKFSWEVESDAMEWEHAVEGIRYASERLEDFKNLC
ncbi:MAG: hypothetical protein HY879_03610 [Deltaproteobacteria bacterium]|nr:hypothetical protein [Deltaproteobacteria bacterium]